MSKTRLILARYSVLRAGRGLGFQEQLDLLGLLKDAPPVSHRVREPRADDFTNYIIRPGSGSVRGRNYITWQVCRQLHQRTVRRVDRKAQSLRYDFEATEDCLVARLVAIPSLGVIAAEDGSGEGHIGGWSAIARYRSIAEVFDPSMDVQVQLAGTPQDLDKAVMKWDLEKFTFEARPFNPHPSNPGQMLSDLLSKDGIAKVRGEAIPSEGNTIHPADMGLVKETMGLAEHGYAVYGAEGTTPSGAHAKVTKPKFSFDREKNKRAIRGEQQLRVTVDGEDEEMAQRFAEVLIDFFAPDDDEA